MQSSGAVDKRVIMYGVMQSSGAVDKRVIMYGVMQASGACLKKPDPDNIKKHSNAFSRTLIKRPPIDRRRQKTYTVYSRNP